MKLDTTERQRLLRAIAESEERRMGRTFPPRVISPSPLGLLLAHIQDNAITAAKISMNVSTCERSEEN